MGTWVIKSREDYERAMEEINERLDVMREALEKVPPETLQKLLVQTLAKAVQRAPLDEGHLRRSGHLTVNDQLVAYGTRSGAIVDRRVPTPETNSELIEFVVGFFEHEASDHGAGDVNTYAVTQHEHSEFRHPKGGQDHYLSTAIEEDRGGWKDAIRKAIKEALS